ncbi:MAG: SipW-dependent-type signal peptide-containing protein [Candidatus Excrementavichristensenella sp.]|jgi:predicted ribosomally synthesized peptide with SipW-like signal peptide
MENIAKKRLVAVSMFAVIAAIAVGATLAYFTDTDQATNTFTVGNVAIDLIEQQRGANGLEDFENEKILMPIVGSAQGDKDAYGMPVAANYVDKMVTVKNTGASGAWVRAYFAIPSALDNGYDSFNAGLNVLHFNFGSHADGSTTYGTEWLWKHGAAWNYYETVIGNVNYNVYFADYYQALAAGATTVRFVNGVYLDKTFEKKADGYYAFGEKLTLPASMLGADGNIKTITCPVMAVAVQADGFADAATAVTEAFGDKYNPFGGAATNWQ